MKISSRVTLSVRIGFVALALVMLGLAVASQWGDVKPALSDIGVMAVIAALLAAIVGLFFNAMAWRQLLVDQGSPLSHVQTIRVFFLAQIGKYLPGSVWPYLAQMELARDLGVPRQRTGVASIVVVGLQVLTGLIVAAGTLPFTSAEALRRFWWALAAVPIGLAMLHPRFLNPMLARACRLLRRSEPPPRLTGVGLARSAAWLLILWLCYGLSVLALAMPLGIDGAQAVLVAVGAYGLAWSAGLLFLPAPAGIGVREGALVLALSVVMSVPDAVAVAAVCRVVQTAGDGVWAGVALLLRKEMTARPTGSNAVNVPALTKDKSLR